MSHQNYIRRDLTVEKFKRAWKPTNLSETTIDFKCTPGVGDFMYILSVAYMRSFVLQKTVTLNLHWYHNKDYLFHFEDPETILERFEYVNNFYLKNNTDVVINHIFDANNSSLYVKRYYGFKKGWGEEKPDSRFIGLKYNSWEFKPSTLETNPSKIVIWTQLQNAQVPRNFKQPFEKYGWEEAKKRIEAHGYDITEISYRTPISEVMYHIATCRATVSYEGMWHYVPKNYHKPMIVLSADTITQLHTPNALSFKDQKDWFDYHWFDNFDSHLEEATMLAQRGERLIRKLHKKVD